MKKFIAIALLAIMCSSLCSCSTAEVVSDVAEDVVSDVTEKTTPAEKGKKTFSVGEVAEVDKVSVSMTNVYESKGAQFFEPADGKVFVICEFNIENNSDKELNVSSMLNFNAYCDDYACDLSITALSANNDKQQLDGTVAAGKKLSGIVGYEVPAEWSNMEVRFSPGLLTNEEVVFVATK